MQCSCLNLIQFGSLAAWTQRYMHRPSTGTRIILALYKFHFSFLGLAFSCASVLPLSFGVQYSWEVHVPHRDDCRVSLSCCWAFIMMVSLRRPFSCFICFCRLYLRWLIAVFTCLIAFTEIVFILVFVPALFFYHLFMAVRLWALGPAWRHPFVLTPYCPVLHNWCHEVIHLVVLR